MRFQAEPRRCKHTKKDVGLRCERSSSEASGRGQHVRNDEQDGEVLPLAEVGSHERQQQEQQNAADEQSRSFALMDAVNE